MWADIGNSLQIFEAYKEYINVDESLQDALFDILVELILFAVFTIKTIKHVRIGVSNFSTHPFRCRCMYLLMCFRSEFASVLLQG
jgi:hypothetical protein